MRWHKEEISKAIRDLCFSDLENLILRLETFGEEECEKLWHQFLQEGHLVLRWPDESKKIARRNFISATKELIASKGFQEAANALSRLNENIDLIELGYASILEALAELDCRALNPTVRAWAILRRGAADYLEILQRTDDAVAKAKELGGHQSIFIKDDHGNDIHSDAAHDAITKAAAHSLLIESHENGWDDNADSVVRLPEIIGSSERELQSVRGMFTLAQIWTIWSEIEERVRLFDGEIAYYDRQNNPSRFEEIPLGINELIVADAHLAVGYPFVIARRRLAELVYQRHLDVPPMSPKPFDAHIALPPTQFLDAEEAIAYIRLKEILGFPIDDDDSTYCGLRLTEWIRGNSYLRCIVRSRHLTNATDSNALLPHLTIAELLDSLNRIGLTGDKAKTFIGHISLKKSSRDLFDCPLVRIGDEKAVLFGPVLLRADTAQVVLSQISSAGEQIDRKGPAFEQSFREIFLKRGLHCKSTKVKRRRKEYEYDALVDWGDYIFLFECKNNALPTNGLLEFHFLKKTGSNVRQVERLLEALRKYPEILTDLFGPEAASKQIVPCVVNSLPFSCPLTEGESICFSDVSAVKRFFHAPTIQQIELTGKYPEGAPVVVARDILRVWDGDKPTPEDFIRQLVDPPQWWYLQANLHQVFEGYEITPGFLLACSKWKSSPESTNQMLARLGLSTS